MCSFVVSLILFDFHLLRHSVILFDGFVVNYYMQAEFLQFPRVQVKSSKCLEKDTGIPQ